MINFIGSIVTSAGLSASLIALLAWIFRSWIGERLKGAIQQEYAERLETHKAALKAESDYAIESLKSQLGEYSADRSARRDYEYEARKKLYGEYEPLLFQLIEQAENAYYRILSLSRSTRDGRLGDRPNGWLSHEGYYMRSTLYKLLAPIALYKIIQRKLTFVDLSVDPAIAANYTLTKVLYLTFTCDFELASQLPPIDYDPTFDTGESHQSVSKQIKKQGIPLGCLDNVLHDYLILEDAVPRLRSFGEFERAMSGARSTDASSDIRYFFEIFSNFHPESHPVLWRILLAQAHIYRLLIARVGARSESPTQDLMARLDMPESERDKLRWRDGDSDGGEFDAARSFVKAYISEFEIRL